MRHFTSEYVSPGHPDKVADQISDAVLDAYLSEDEHAHVACETLVTQGQVVLAGEVSSTAQANIDTIVRKAIRDIGYTKPEYGFCDSCVGIINLLHRQSPDIRRGVDRENKRMQGAGDQGMMFGYATNENRMMIGTEHYIARTIIQELDAIRMDGRLMPYLRPDAKAQVTIAYDASGKPCNVDTVVLSASHDVFASDKAMHERIGNDVREILIPIVLQRLERNVSELFRDGYNLLINPTGRFVTCGPAGDTGLTGRKIMVDAYGGRAAHGGGAFSGKDPSKVDRSAAYAARYVAKNLVAAGYADEITMQVAYAIGVANPVSVTIVARGLHGCTTQELEALVLERADLSPYGIEQMLHLKKPIYLPRRNSAISDARRTWRTARGFIVGRESTQGFSGHDIQGENVDTGVHEDSSPLRKGGGNAPYSRWFVCII